MNILGLASNDLGKPPIAVVQSTRANPTTTPSVTLGSAPQSASTLVAILTDKNSGGVGNGTATVSQGATAFGLLGSGTTGTTFRWAVYTLSSPGTGTSITTGSLGATGTTGLCVYELSAVAADPLDAVPTGTAGASSPIVAGSQTPSAAGDIFFSVFFNNNTITTPTVPTGYTSDQAGVSVYTAYFARKIQTGAAAAEAPSWSFSGTASAPAVLLFSLFNG